MGGGFKIDRKPIFQVPKYNIIQKLGSVAGKVLIILPVGIEVLLFVAKFVTRRGKLHFFQKSIDRIRPLDCLEWTQNIAQSRDLGEYVLKIPKLFEIENKVAEIESVNVREKSIFSSKFCLISLLSFLIQLSLVCLNIHLFKNFVILEGFGKGTILGNRRFS